MITMIISGDLDNTTDHVEDADGGDDNDNADLKD